MNPMNWYDAKVLVAKMNDKNFGGHSDWRLPTVKELISLIDYESQESIVNQLDAQGYIGVQARYYWSSTTYASNTNHAWIMGMYGGLVYSLNKTYNLYVWPVRGELEFLKDLTSLDLVK